MIFNVILFIFHIIFFEKTEAVPDIDTHRNNLYKSCDSIPKLNQEILDFVTTKIRKKVGRGECWDLAAEALWSADAKWDGRYKFGVKVDHKSECVFAGDIIQLENVKAVHKTDRGETIHMFPHHTAIIYEVKGKGLYILAHQNTEFSGRKVGLSPLDLAEVVKGKFTIYRPTM